MSLEDCVNWGSNESERNHPLPITAVKSCSPAGRNGTGIAPLESLNTRGRDDLGCGCEEARGEGLRWDAASVGVCLLLYGHLFIYFILHILCSFSPYHFFRFNDPHRWLSPILFHPKEHLLFFKSSDKIPGIKLLRPTFHKNVPGFFPYESSIHQSQQQHAHLEINLSLLATDQICGKIFTTPTFRNVDINSLYWRQKLAEQRKSTFSTRLHRTMATCTEREVRGTASLPFPSSSLLSAPLKLRTFSKHTHTHTHTITRTGVMHQ